MLRKWLCRPLRFLPAIEERLDAVGELATRAGDLAGPPCILG